MHCLHCGSLAGEGRKRKAELTTRQALELCDQLAKMGNRRLTISGGEPLLRKDWHQIAGRAIQNGIQTGMITNGWFIKDNLDKFRKLRGMEIIGISIDGNRAVHDRIRRVDGSFDKAVEAIDMLKAEGFKVAVSTSVCRLNLEKLPEMYEIFLTHNVDAWQFQIIFTGGRMREYGDLVLQPLEMKRLAQFIAEKRAEKSSLLVYPTDCIGYFTELEAKIRDHSWEGCPAGKYGIGIEANGDIKGCLSLAPELLRNNPFVEGNIKKHTLQEIWNRPGAFGYNRDFDFSQVKPPCKGCRYLETCRSGCSSAAYHFTGDIHCNPYCLYALEKG